MTTFESLHCKYTSWLQWWPCILHMPRINLSNIMTDTTTSSRTTTPLTAAVSVKLPTFWMPNLDTWFHQADIQFTLKGHYSWGYSLLLRGARVSHTQIGENVAITERPLLQSDEGFTVGHIWPIHGSMDEAFPFNPRPGWPPSLRMHLHGWERPNFLLLFFFKWLLPASVWHALAASMTKDPECSPAKQTAWWPILRTAHLWWPWLEKLHPFPPCECYPEIMHHHLCPLNSVS